MCLRKVSVVLDAEQSENVLMIEFDELVEWHDGRRLVQALEKLFHRYASAEQSASENLGVDFPVEGAEFFVLVVRHFVLRRMHFCEAK